MLEFFLSYISAKNLIQEGEKTLLAVSGGVDSMVMADLFAKSGLPFGIAHLNHLTRGEENFREATLVRLYAEKNGIEYHYHEIDKSKMTTGNFQAAARNYRYRWLHDIMDQFHYHKIATAHHEDDVIESFMLNIFRGSGLEGLEGIRVNLNAIIRPILFASKSMILDYAQQNGIDFLEDSSNLQSGYRRNFLRNELFPIIAQKIPAYKAGVKTTISNISSTQQLINSLIQDLMPDIMEINQDIVIIDSLKLIKFNPPETLLYYLLKDYGFNSDQCSQIIHSVHHTGARFYSAQYILWIDRQKLKLKTLPKDKDDNINLNIDKCGIYSVGANRYLEVAEGLSGSDHDISSVVYFDYYPFPLILRRWLPGDYFKPAQMKGQGKKVKKFLTDLKISGPDKSNQTVLLDNRDKIICLPGIDIAHSTESKGEHGYALSIRLVPHERNEG